MAVALLTVPFGLNARRGNSLVAQIERVPKLREACFWRRVQRCFVLGVLNVFFFDGAIATRIDLVVCAIEL